MKAKFLVAVALLIMGLLAQVALAKGPPQKVTISGEGLLSEIVFTGDQSRLDLLAMMTLEDSTTISAAAPQGISKYGYLITRYFETAPDQFVPFDQVVYFPDPAGGRGYIFYGGIVNGSSDYDNHWFRANPQGEAVLQALIAEGQAESQAAKAALRNFFVSTFERIFTGNP